ncbi:hypothetical protein [Burkholderia arboris]|uniref:hypothetical protein n=1 Tax=Burkholderia arboris TaxID=488730 RepID=UPI0015821E09|nr:hypothetical protein [Burkholderia arboris]
MDSAARVQAACVHVIGGGTGSDDGGNSLALPAGANWIVPVSGEGQTCRFVRPTERWTKPEGCRGMAWLRRGSGVIALGHNLRASVGELLRDNFKS